MPALQFSTQAYGRPGLGLPEARLINCLLEPTPAGPTQAARFGRPGLTANGTVGVGPSWGRFRASGAFDGETFEISGTELYREGVLVDALPGSGQPQWAFYGDDDEATSEDQLGILRDGVYYVYDGTTLETITAFEDDDPDTLPYFVDIEVISSRGLLLTRSGRYYWTEVADLKTINALSFATAETAADGGVALAKRGQQIAVFGNETVEWLFPTGDADAPFQSTQSATFDRGCACIGSVARIDNTIAWVGEDRIVYRASDVPVRISTHGIEQRLRQCGSIEDIHADIIAFDGHTLLILHIPGQGTFAYDFSTTQWTEFQSYERELFRARYPLALDGEITFGDDETGGIWHFDPEAFSDNGDPLTRLISGGALIKSGAIRCDSVMLQCARGVGLATGPGSRPVVEMRYSDDAGQTWSDWEAEGLGLQGEYSVKAIWRRLGLMTSPGRVFEWRVTDPVLVTFSGATINEPRP
jgi:hypothetical protein